MNSHPPLAAWSSVLTSPQLNALPRTNPDVKVWMVHSADGLDYVLRAFGRWRPGASLADEYRVQLHLQAAGIPVAVPLLSDAGTLAVKLGDDNYVLSPRLANGHRTPDTPEIRFRIGEAIGKLHTALSRYPHPVTSYRLDLAHDAFEVAAKKLPPDVQLLIRPHESKARAALAGLPVQLIHGDCNDGNVLLNGGRVTGFIDFDHLPVGERIYDLAYYMAHVVRRGGRASIREYVDGYDAANPLTPEERAAVPAAMLAVEVSLTSWSCVLLTEMRDRARAGEAARYQRGLKSLADAVVADFSVDGGSGHA